MNDASAATVRYEGEFELAWLGDGERVMSAGDGTGAAIIVLTDGNELRVNIGDEIPVKSAPGQAPSSPNGWRPASETETAGGSSSAKRDRLACWLCNQILNHLATPWYRKMVSGSIRYGLLQLLATSAKERRVVDSRSSAATTEGGTSMKERLYCQVRDFGLVRLLEAPVPTTTQLYHAIQTLECAICEDRIPGGDLFTRALAPGHGRVRVPHCRACRPFEISQDAIHKARQKGRRDA